MKTPDFKDRLGAASAAKKAQIERARAIAEDPTRLRRIEARSEIIAARKAEEEAREAKRVEQAQRDAAAAAEREEALLAIRRAGRKKKSSASRQPSPILSSLGC